MTQAPSSTLGPLSRRGDLVPGNVRKRPELPSGKIPTFGQRLALLEWDADHGYYLIDGLQQELKFLRDTLEMMEDEARGVSQEETADGT